MFLNPWSVALCLLSLVVLILLGIASRTAVKVLRHWNPASDSNRQISLENETWLSSTLVQYALGFQLFSLVLFVLAADNFSHVISGAMCAVGSLTANRYGMPALWLKLAGAFLYGLWLVVHHFDISSERYPLLKFKYAALLGLMPLLGADIACQTLYLAGLKPDIITSCCAVVFGEGEGKGGNLMASLPENRTLALFYGLAAVLAVLGHFLFRRRRPSLMWLSGGLWAVFVGLALAAITSVFSSYVYAMPYHHCPFCLLKPEYGYIGFLIYGALLPAGFFGISAALASLVPAASGLSAVVDRFQRRAVLISCLLLVVFVISVSYHLVLYRLSGGEG